MWLELIELFWFAGVAREVVKHPGVKSVHQVEIDGRVVELSKKYLPSMACGFDSPKVALTIGDGFEYMKQHAGEFDVIITDSSDPIGPAESLFQESYFALMKKALKPNGVICSQGGTFWTDIDHVKATMAHCRKQFPTVGYAITSVPSYPCGQIGFIIASTNENHELKTPKQVFTEEQLDGMNLRYYSAETHRAAFEGLPRSTVKQLYGWCVRCDSFMKFPLESVLVMCFASINSPFFIFARKYSWILL